MIPAGPVLEFAFGVEVTLDPPLLLGGPRPGETAIVHVTGGSFDRGYRWGTRDVMDRLAAGDPVDPSAYYMRVTPRFEVREGAHDWLRRHVFVGVGRKTPTGNHIDYFVVTG